MLGKREFAVHLSAVAQPNPKGVEVEGRLEVVLVVVESPCDFSLLSLFKNGVSEQPFQTASLLFSIAISL
jgi:hypothetical protein